MLLQALPHGSTDIRVPSRPAVPIPTSSAPLPSSVFSECGEGRTSLLPSANQLWHWPGIPGHTQLLTCLALLVGVCVMTCERHTQGYSHMHACMQQCAPRHIRLPEELDQRVKRFQPPTMSSTCFPTTGLLLLCRCPLGVSRNFCFISLNLPPP